MKNEMETIDPESTMGAAESTAGTESRIQKLTRKQKEFVDAVGGIHAACEIIKIYYYASIKGTTFASNRIASKADKIKEFATSITDKEMKGLVNISDRDGFRDDHALQLFRLFDYFLFCPTRSLEEFADSVCGKSQEVK